eukprot:jgi/Bigna1/74217/fgenesh1_pg.28_\
MRLFQGIHVVAYGCDAAQLEIWERQVFIFDSSDTNLMPLTGLRLLFRCEAFRKPLPLLKTDWLAASLHYERLVWTKFYHWNLAVRVSKMIRKRTVSAPCSNSRLSSLNFENDISPRTRIKRNRPASFTEARRVTNRQGGEISSPFCNPSSSSSSSSGRYVGKLPVVLTWNANNLRARLVGLGGKGGSSVGVGGGGEGLKDLAILHNVDIICIQEMQSRHREECQPSNLLQCCRLHASSLKMESRLVASMCITLQLREELVLLVTYSPQDSFNTCRSCSAIDMLEGGHGGIGTSERRKLLNQSQIPCFRTQVWDRALRKYISSLLSEPRKKHLIWCGDMNALHDVKKDRLFRNRGEGASAKSYVYLHVPKGNRAEKEKVKELGGVFPPHIEMDEKRYF